MEGTSGGDESIRVGRSARWWGVPTRDGCVGVAVWRRAGERHKAFQLLDESSAQLRFKIQSLLADWLQPLEHLMRTLILVFAVANLLVSNAAMSQQEQPPAAIKAAPLGREALRNAQAEGKEAAYEVGTWFGRSMLIGALTGLVGTGITYAVASGSRPPQLSRDQELIIANEPIEWRRMYENAYLSEAKRRRKKSVLVGGLIGTGIAVTLIVVGSTPQ